MPGNDNNTDKILAEIDSLLQNFQQTGGNGAVLDEINALLSEYRGEETTLSEAEVMRLAQRGGAKKKSKSKGKKKAKSKSKGKKKASKSKGKKKSKSKSKGKKKTASKSKAKRKTKSKSKGKKKTASKSKASKSKSKRKTASKSKAKKSRSKSKGRKAGKKTVARRAGSKSKAKRASKSKSKSRGRKMKREEGEKPKRKMNPFMAELTVLRRFLMDKLGDELKPMNVGALSSAASILLKANDVNAEKAKKAFNKQSFMNDYNAAKKRIEAKKAAKKAAKAAAMH